MMENDMSPSADHRPWMTDAMKRFAHSERGTVITEFVIIFPILIWAWIAMFYYVDVYRAINLAQKASFTVSDALSRSPEIVSMAYIDGTAKLLTYLTDTKEDVRLRVTSLRWNAVAGTHQVSWSYSPGAAFDPLEDGDLAALASRLPTLTAFETVILVETEIEYTPPEGAIKIGSLDLGVGPQTFDEFVVTRPRFVNKVCLLTKPCV